MLAVSCIRKWVTRQNWPAAEIRRPSAADEIRFLNIHSGTWWTGLVCDGLVYYSKASRFESIEIINRTHEFRSLSSRATSLWFNQRTRVPSQYENIESRGQSNGLRLLSEAERACRASPVELLALLSPVYTSNNVEATLSNATSRTILSTKSNVASTLLLVRLVWTGLKFGTFPNTMQYSTIEILPLCGPGNAVDLMCVCVCVRTMTFEQNEWPSTYLIDMVYLDFSKLAFVRSKFKVRW